MDTVEFAEEDAELELAKIIKTFRERQRQQVVYVVNGQRSIDAYTSDENYITCRFCGQRQTKFQHECFQCHEILGT